MNDYEWGSDADRLDAQADRLSEAQLEAEARAEAAETLLASAESRIEKAKVKLDEAVMESRHGRTASSEWIDKQVDEARALLDQPRGGE